MVRKTPRAQALSRADLQSQDGVALLQPARGLGLSSNSQGDLAINLDRSPCRLLPGEVSRAFKSLLA